MRILTLDSCGSSCGVGVWLDGRLLAFRLERMERGQDARLMPLVCEAMKGAACGFSDLDRIAVTRGPGSFTGTRVGLAAARGMGLASGKPVIGIDRFAIYKAMHGGGKNLLVVIDSKRAELFCKFFPAKGEAGEARMMTKEVIQAFLDEHRDTDVAGDCTPNIKFPSQHRSTAQQVSCCTPPSLPALGLDAEKTAPGRFFVSASSPARGREFFPHLEDDKFIFATCAELAAKADLQNAEFQPIPLYIRPPDVTMGKAC